MKKNIIIAIIGGLALQSCIAQVKPKRNVGRESSVDISVAEGLVGFIDSNGVKVPRTVSPASIAPKSQLDLKASQTDLSNLDLQIRSDLAEKTELNILSTNAKDRIIRSITYYIGISDSWTDKPLTFFFPNIATDGRYANDGWHRIVFDVQKTPTQLAHIETSRSFNITGMPPVSQVFTTVAPSTYTGNQSVQNGDAICVLVINRQIICYYAQERSRHINNAVAMLRDSLSKTVSDASKVNDSIAVHRTELNTEKTKIIALKTGYYIEDFGAATGVNDDAIMTAFLNINQAQKTLYIDKKLRLTQNFTIPSNVTLSFSDEGFVQFSTTGKFTFDTCNIVAPEKQIFFSEYSYSENYLFGKLAHPLKSIWTGVLPDGKTNYYYYRLKDLHRFSRLQNTPIQYQTGYYRSTNEIDTSNINCIYDPESTWGGTFHFTGINGKVARNIKNYGSLITYERVGFTNCDSVYIDDILILADSGKTVSKNINGAGIHVYYNSHNINVRNVEVRNTNRSAGLLIDAESYHEYNRNVNFGNVLIKNSQVNGANFYRSYVNIDNLTVENYGNGSLSDVGINLYIPTNAPRAANKVDGVVISDAVVKIKKLVINTNTSTSLLANDALIINTGGVLYVDELYIDGARNNGIKMYAGAKLYAGKIFIRNCFANGIDNNGGEIICDNIVMYNNSTNSSSTKEVYLYNNAILNTKYLEIDGKNAKKGGLYIENCRKKIEIFSGKIDSCGNSDNSSFAVSLYNSSNVLLSNFDINSYQSQGLRLVVVDSCIFKNIKILDAITSKTGIVGASISNNSFQDCINKNSGNIAAANQYEMNCYNIGKSNSNNTNLLFPTAQITVNATIAANSVYDVDIPLADVNSSSFFNYNINTVLPTDVVVQQTLIPYLGAVRVRLKNLSSSSVSLNNIIFSAIRFK